MIWSKRKFKIDKALPAMRICEMNIEQAALAKEAFYKLSSAAGYADDGRRQNMWTNYECEAEARIKELTTKKGNRPALTKSPAAFGGNKEKRNGSNKKDRT